MEERVIIECSKLYPALCFDMYGGPGFHNVYVGLLVIISAVWLVNRLSKIIELYEMIKIIQEEGRVINIPSLGPYSNDLKKLIKSHISQIIRERCSISPTTVKKVQVMSILEESTLKTRLIPNSSSSSSPDESYSLEISFKIDSLVPYSVQLFWGVDYLETKKLLIEENKEETEKESKGSYVANNKELRRMGLGSSIAMYDQLKYKEKVGLNSQEDSKLGNKTKIGLGYISVNEYNSLNKSRALFENMVVDNDEKERVDLNIPLDFSPSESMKSIAHLNPILYTTEIQNRRDFYENNHDRNYFDHHTNISSGGVLIIGSRITCIIQKIKQKLRDNIVTDFISDSLNYSRWNSSLLGDNALILSRTIKRVFERVFFYNIVLPTNNHNYINNNMNLGGLNLTKSSLLSSASATTELLLDASNYDKVASNSKSIHNKYNINLTKIINKPNINMKEIKKQILIEKLDPMYITEEKSYEKGLSQEFCERIKLTPEYLSSCNLNSLYCDNQEEQEEEKKQKQQQEQEQEQEKQERKQDQDQTKCLNQVHDRNNDHYYFNGDYYEIQDNYNNKEIFWNNKLFEFNNNDTVLTKKEGINGEKENKNVKKIARIPLLILIRANMGIIKDESVLSNNIVVVHFDLIQDHYNMPYLMYKPLILKQVMSNSHGILIEPYDTFGLEDDESDCLICMSNPKDVILLPCRHCISCESCLRSLRQDKCPLCRTKFSGFVVLPIKNS
ncbi:uncharacterized protein cubi_01570 [Cryptosporidium ubiquitum]|uniref:RING-type domain-containing protein n=1 Tax=Cryptosporidium ubiquitum TaxID=857276 RepID=A0A1J4MHB9_9CRYT|nr:uncharacterized protein cubi_01570 [Cryptosporidium ubiquitum]OII72237.1 hypothetical protein cubi_01570 [Cryptosporidium ubiquitum]